MIVRGVALATALLTIGAARPPVPSVLEVPIDGRIAITLSGRTVTAFAGPGMPSRLNLSRATAVAMIGPDADRFEVPDTGFRLISIRPATGVKVGPVEVRGRAESIASNGRDKVPVSWFETDAYPLGEVLAGPWALPETIVSFRLAPAGSGEVTASFPLDRRLRWWLATTTRTIGGHDVTFAFAPQFPRTVASAAAGAAIVRALGGRFDGAREAVAISHGVARPARQVTLDRPLDFGPVAIDRLLVRTADYGSTAAIVDPSEASVDDDVVVTGRRRSRPSYVVYLGADLLGGCSAIRFDKPGRRIDLTCRLEPSRVR